MAIPDRDEAAALLASFDPPDWFLAHVSAVADAAAWLARAAAGRGAPVPIGLVEVAALLHDVDKLLPRDDRLLELGHGRAGARWLTERGYGELAGAVAHHPVSRLGDDGHYERWRREAPLEELIVAYADKRAGQRLEPLASRFADWERRSGEHRAELARIRPRAEELEAHVCRAAGVAPHDVRRLRWSRPALTRAAEVRGARRAAGRSPAHRDREPAEAG